MANTSQATDLEGLYYEMHSIVEQIRIMNKNNARLIQHLAIANPPPLVAPLPEGVDRTHRSQRLSDDESQSHQSTGQARSNKNR